MLSSKTRVLFIILIFCATGFLSVNMGCSGKSGKSIVSDIIGSDDSDDVGASGQPSFSVLYERSLDPSEANQARSSDNSLVINLAANSFESQSKLSVTKYPVRTVAGSIPSEFEFMSDLYSISFLDETASIGLPSLKFSLGQITQPTVSFLSTPATITIQLNRLPEAGAEYFIAVSQKRNQWQLLSTPHTSMEFTYATSNLNGSYAIVKRVANFEGMLAGAITVETPIQSITASTTEILEKNINVTMRIPFKSPTTPNSTNSTIAMELGAMQDFSFKISHPTNEVASLTVSASTPTAGNLYLSNPINPFDYCQMTLEGNDTLYTFVLGLKGQRLTDLPTALSVKASYHGLNGIIYSGEQMLYFKRAEGLNIVSVSPQEAAIILPRGQEFTITFNRKMDKATTSEAISLNEYGQEEAILLNSSTWTNDRTIVASAATQLKFDTSYQLTVTGAMAEDGAKREEPFKFLYKTATQTSDILMQAPQLTDVATNTNFIFAFPRKMQANTLVEPNFTLTEVGSGPVGIYVSSASNSSVTLRLQPGVFLNHNATYTMSISANVLDASGSPISEYTSPQFTTIARPKALSETRIPSESINIPINSEFKISFSREMKEESAMVADAIELIEVDSGAKAEFNILWENGNETLIIRPKSLLSANVDYKLKYNEGLQDIFSNSIEPAEFEFTTSNLTYVVSTSPNLTGSPTDIATNTAFVVTFSKEIAIIGPRDVDLRSEAGFSTPCSVQIDGNIATITPDVAMQHGVLYDLIIKSSVKDVNGVGVVEFIKPFTTSIKPLVTGNNTTYSGVYVNKVFEIEFNKSMNTTRTQTAFSVRPMNGSQAGAAVAGSFSWSEQDKKLTFTPTSPLEFLKDYRLEITSSACDAGLNAIDRYVHDFRTTSQTTVTMDAITKGSMQGVIRTVATSTAFIATFTRKIDQVATSLDDKVLLKDSSGASLAKTLSWKDDLERKVLLLTPNDPLEYDKTYTLELSDEIIDEHRQKIAPLSITQTTDVRPEMTISPAVWDETNPNIWPSDKLILTFTKKMDTDRVESALTILLINTSDTLAPSFDWSEDKKLVSISAPWVQGKTYKVTIDKDNAYDSLGNGIAESFIKNVEINSGASFSELTIDSISNTHCRASCTIKPLSGASFAETGVFWQVKGDSEGDSEIATFNISPLGTFTDKQVSGFAASTTYVITPYATYSDSLGNPFTEFGTPQEFSTNPLGGGVKVAGTLYLLSTVDYPYLVSTPKELMIISQHQRAPLNGYYEQTADIDMFHDTLVSNLSSYDGLYDETEGFRPIGTDANPFTGQYNGRDKKISGFTIRRGTEENIGLFGCIKGAKLERIVMIDSEIRAKGTCGTLVGLIQQDGSNGSTIASCSAIVHNNPVNGGVYASGNFVGGILGKAVNYTKIEKTNFSGRIVGDTTASDIEHYGGIAGYIGTYASVDNCNILSKYESEKGITGTEISTTGDNYLDKAGGIAGACDEGTVIKLCNAKIELSAGNIHQTAGGIVGVATTTNIISCTTEGVVSAKNPGSIAGQTHAGSIVGCSVNTQVSQNEGTANCIAYTVNAGTTINEKDATNLPNQCSFDGHTCNYSMGSEP